MSIVPKCEDDNTSFLLQCVYVKHSFIVVNSY